MISQHLTQFAGYPVRQFDPEKGITEPGTIYRLSVGYDERNWFRRTLNLPAPVNSWSDRLDQFVNDPEAVNAKGIVVGAWMGEQFDLGSKYVVDLLIDSAKKLPSLHAIFLGDITSEENEISWIQQSDVSPLFTAFPNLTHFGVRGGDGLEFGQIEHQNLRHLVVQTGGMGHQITIDLIASQLPELSHFEIYIGTEEYGRTTEVDHLITLLQQNPFPKLSHLGLRNAENADAIATAIADAPILDQLETLDLSLGTLSDKGAKALLASQRLHKLKKLDLHFHYFSNNMMEKLQELPIEVNVSDQQLEEDDDWRYVAVGE